MDLDVGAHLDERVGEAEAGSRRRSRARSTRPSAWVSATMSGCCQSVMKPGCTSVSSDDGFSSPPGWQKRMPSSPMSSAPPTLRKTLRNVIMSALLRAPDEDVAVGGERGARPSRRPRCGRRARGGCSRAGRSTPSMRMTRSVSTVMIAPIFCRTAMRSMISGSMAALRSSVMPSARTAVSSTCSVAPTLGYGRSILAPCRPLGAEMRMPSGACRRRRRTRAARRGGSRSDGRRCGSRRGRG